MNTNKRAPYAVVIVKAGQIAAQLVSEHDTAEAAHEAANAFRPSVAVGDGLVSAVRVASYRRPIAL